MQEQENELAFQKGVVEQAQQTHYHDHEVLMAKTNKLWNEVDTAQIKVQKF